MSDDWKIHWENYLRKKFGNAVPDEAFKINLGEIDFYIPPLLGNTAESMKAIQKHNAKNRIF